MSELPPGVHTPLPRRSREDVMREAALVVAQAPEASEELRDRVRLILRSAGSAIADHAA